MKRMAMIRWSLVYCAYHDNPVWVGDQHNPTVLPLQDSHSEASGTAETSTLVKKAAAAMAVGVGSFKDPDQLQVCAQTGLTCLSLAN